MLIYVDSPSEFYGVAKGSKGLLSVFSIVLCLCGWVVVGMLQWSGWLNVIDEEGEHLVLQLITFLGCCSYFICKYSKEECQKKEELDVQGVL